MEKIALFILLLPILSLAYHDKCIPDCIPGNTPPNQGGPMCRCTPQAYLYGCQVAACKPGEGSAKEYTCMCVPGIEPKGCVNPRCNNSTLSATTADGSETAGVDTTMCNKPCNCRDQPPDCTSSSKNPADGGSACTCTVKHWLTGCTMRPCKLGDTHDEIYWWFCECTKDYSPDFCYTPLCASLID